MQFINPLRRAARSRLGIIALLTFQLAGCGGGGGGGGSSTPQRFSLSASVSGLTSSGLVLSVNGDSVPVASGSSAVTLATELSAGTSYTVSVSSQPMGQLCSVASGSGTITSANIANVVVTCALRSFTVGGTVSGLSSTGLVLANGADTVTVSSGATTFTLPVPVANTSSYAIAVQTQPSGQTCGVSNGSGTINNANVTGIVITCTNQPFSVGGSIGGLGNHSGLVLANGSDTYNVPPNATSFTLPAAVNFGSSYAVTVQSNPAFMTCSAGNATGTMGAANVTNVAVVCSTVAYSIGGTVSGLTQSGLVLANGTDTLAVSGGATSYTLPTAVAHGSNYAVTVQTQPTGQTCSISNATGTVAGSAVTNASVTCATNTYTVGGNISGLTAGGLVLANGTDTLTVSANSTSFTMPTGVAFGAAYNITVNTKPLLQSCAVTHGNGTVGGAVSNVQIACSAGATFTALHYFARIPEGSDPQGNLIEASDGNFYGLTQLWGGGNSGGTVFKMTPSGTLTALHAFTGGTDGANPEGSLIQANDGLLYGMAVNGGSNSDGAVFKITLAETLTPLYSFTGGSDGATPAGSLIQASDGDLYGMNVYGSNGYGTVFKITTSGTLTTLHEFTGGNDGGNPHGDLIQASDGNLYGMTLVGGSNNLGTVFKISTGGTLTTLHSFTGGNDGASPVSSLIQASDGNFYGMTTAGGIGHGTVFKITSSGTLTTLHAFTGGSDGGSPNGRLLQASDGNFYGMCNNGGSANVGIVFQITPTGTLTTLYSFTDGIDGRYPIGSLIQASDGSLYGMTRSVGYGTVFKMR